MKKSFLVLVLLSLCFFPFRVSANNILPASIKTTTIMGTDRGEVGKEFSLSFSISFDGIEKNNANSLGIMLVSYELVFDDSVFTVTDITSNQWDSAVFLTEDGKYYVLSAINENNPSQNKCADGVLYCSDYIVSLRFFVKETEQEKSVIKMNDIEVGMLKMLDLYPEQTNDDIELLVLPSGSSRTIQIKQPESESATVQEPASIIEEKKTETVENVKIPEAPKPQEQPVTVTKSNNNQLKALIVENYNLSFDKNNREYELLVEKGIHSLNVKAETEDSKATYQIIGAENLTENNNQIRIEVTAENGEKATYLIRVKEKETEETTEIQKEDKSEEEKKKMKIDQKYLIISGIFLLLVFLLKLILHIRDRRLEKGLDNL